MDMTGPGIQNPSPQGSSSQPQPSQTQPAQASPSPSPGPQDPARPATPAPQDSEPWRRHLEEHSSKLDSKWDSRFKTIEQSLQKFAPVLDRFGQLVAPPKQAEDPIQVIKGLVNQEFDSNYQQRRHQEILDDNKRKIASEYASNPEYKEYGLELDAILKDEFGYDENSIWRIKPEVLKRALKMAKLDRQEKAGTPNPNLPGGMSPSHQHREDTSTLNPYAKKAYDRLKAAHPDLTVAEFKKHLPGGAQE